MIEKPYKCTSNIVFLSFYCVIIRPNIVTISARISIAQYKVDISKSLLLKKNGYLNPIKNTWGVKKGRGQEEAALVGLHATKCLISLKAKKFGIYIVHTVSVTSLMFMHQNFTTTIGFVTWPPFLYHTLFT